MIKVIKKRVSVFLATLLLSFAFFYAIAQTAYYFYVNDKLEDYAESLLSRSDNIVQQVKEIDTLRSEFSVFGLIR